MNETKIYSKVNFSDKELRGKNFSNCLFENCDFSKADLSGSQIEGCQFSRCNLSLNPLEKTRFHGVTFFESKLVGLQFFKCDKFLLSLIFKNCLIESCNFSYLNLKRAVFTQCVIRRSDFLNADLTDADFKKADLNFSTFHHTNLSGANFTEAVNYSINPLTNKINKAIFSEPEVYSFLNFLDIIIE
jgi:fluoroquinolone resistance protein